MALGTEIVGEEAYDHEFNYLYLEVYRNSKGAVCLYVVLERVYVG